MVIDKQQRFYMELKNTRLKIFWEEWRCDSATALFKRDSFALTEAYSFKKTYFCIPSDSSEKPYSS